MNKILIQIRGGNVEMIAASKDIKIVIVDYDLQDIGVNPVKTYEPDSIETEFHSLYSTENESDSEVRFELKRLHL